MNLVDVVRLLTSGWKVLLVLPFCAAASTWVLTEDQPRTWKAGAAVQLSIGSTNDLVVPGSTRTDSFAFKGQLSNATAILQSRSVLQSAAAEAFDAAMKEHEAGKEVTVDGEVVGDPIPWLISSQKKPGAGEEVPAAAADLREWALGHKGPLGYEAVRAALAVKRPSEGDIVSLELTMGDRAMASLLLDRILASFAVHQRANREGAAASAQRFFETRVEEARGSLARSEDALQTFRQDNDVSNYQEQTRALALQIKDVGFALHNQRAEAAAAAARSAELEGIMGGDTALRRLATSLTEEQELVALIRAHAEATSARVVQEALLAGGAVVPPAAPTGPAAGAEARRGNKGKATPAPIPAGAAPAPGPAAAPAPTTPAPTPGPTAAPTPGPTEAPPAAPLPAASPAEPPVAATRPADSPAEPPVAATNPAASPAEPPLAATSPAASPTEAPTTSADPAPRPVEPPAPPADPASVPAAATAPPAPAATTPSGASPEAPAPATLADVLSPDAPVDAGPVTMPEAIAALLPVEPIAPPPEPDVALRALYAERLAGLGEHRTTLVKGWVEALVEAEARAATVAALEAVLVALDAENRRYAALGSEVARLERAIGIAEREYLELLSSLNLARLYEQRTSAAPPFAVLDPVATPVEPEPAKRVVLVAAAGASTFVALAILILGLAYVDRGLYLPAQVEAALGVPVWGAVPELRKVASRPDADDLASKTPSGRLAVGCAQALERAISGASHRSILVVAPRPGVGTTTVARWVGAFLTARGRRVAVVTPGDPPPEDLELLLVDTPSTSVSALAFDRPAGATAALLVYDAGRPDDEADRRTLDALAKAGTPVIGVVLNHAGYEAAEALLGHVPRKRSGVRVGLKRLLSGALGTRQPWQA